MIWSNDLAALRFTPSDGLHALVLVRKVDFYAAQGRLRLIVERIEPHGVGALQKALEELTRKLEAEGLFAEARKRPLPLLPATVGIATALGGAVIHDLLTVLRQRFAERRVLIRPCRVQGDGAGADVAAAIADLDRFGGVDVIVVARGGGSAEDLWAFNDERVVRAIARARVPVVSAVGHQSDWTLADRVADLRVATPTAAAQRVMPERRALAEKLAELERRLRDGLQRRVAYASSRVETLEARLGSPRGQLEQRRLRIEALVARASHALRTRIPNARGRLVGLAAALRHGAPDAPARRADLDRLARRLVVAHEKRAERASAELRHVAGRLDALSPLAVLARGFALARRADGSIVRDAAVLAVGEPLDVRFARGTARAAVLEVALEDDATTAARERAPRAAVRRPEDE